MVTMFKNGEFGVVGDRIKVGCLFPLAVVLLLPVVLLPLSGLSVISLFHSDGPADFSGMKALLVTVRFYAFAVPILATLNLLLCVVVPVKKRSLQFAIGLGSMLLMSVMAWILIVTV